MLVEHQRYQGIFTWWLAHQVLGAIERKILEIMVISILEIMVISIACIIPDKYLSLACGVVCINY